MHTLPTLSELPEPLRVRVAQQLNTLQEHPTPELAIALDLTEIQASLPLVWASSEFVMNACTRRVEFLPALINQGELLASIDANKLRSMLEQWLASANEDAELQSRLRRFRHLQLARIAWRDIASWATLDETLRDLSNLADICVQTVYERSYSALTAMYGTPVGKDSSTPQHLMILGMGKLGGRELNYSSDIDLIFLFSEQGDTDGKMSISNEEFFLRLGQRVIQHLANKTADGFVFRVDMRLRPFGDSGPLVMSFDGFEDYLQQHGRDWERYAFVKARPITCTDQYATLYTNVIRPFVYRRYLDFSVFEALRDMKQMIAREVERRELHNNIKLGPGGIREVEFIVQAFQLLRGGNDRQLQSPELQTVLPQLIHHKLLTAIQVNELLEAYQLLRRVENRLQQWSDNNTHQLPEDSASLLRLAVSLGHASWESMLSELNLHRQRVSHWFATVVFAVESEPDDFDSALVGFLDPSTSDAERWHAIQALGIHDPKHVTDQMLQVRDSTYYHRLDETGRRRLHLVVPKILRLIAQQPQQALVFARVLRIVEKIGGRTVYLALLHEHPLALQRLINLCAHSEFLAEQIAAFPLLLDELIDERLLHEVPTRESLAMELHLKRDNSDVDDEEREMELLCEYQRIAMFRIAVADLSGRLPLMKVSDRLTDLAELIVQTALQIAWVQLVQRHGTPLYGSSVDDAQVAGVIVVAYGKFGGIELGYGSDLDLVFLHNSTGTYQQTNGEGTLENAVFFARLGQRLVHLLAAHTRAGRLYDVDIRLRPSGKGGLLVQGLQRFDEYQRKEAWTWEHQALIRARAVAGSTDVIEQFEQIRIDVLRQAVKKETLRDEVRKMRQRMRDELSKAKAGEFDLKQDAGGIADIEFLVQYWMLKWASEYPPIIIFTDNIRQLESLASGNIISQGTVDTLTSIYRKYRERIHHLSLAGGDNVIDDGEFAAERASVIALWKEVMED